ncbi:hypothetical protein GCM10010174_66420 [Kutzneria viridogrisea]|uniref:HTH araC/xylS-type domain-containing protein n=2 Tax=Kutzneria TaxID=43356 RepID=W5WD52_9PSEU|nr:helix-turn-helix transcriptional regulator [Kutzneria albida]AHH98792.1 hypothetical protein KALB_5430 [Kutzneria albida DSM 43870]MBA8923690.1 AraC-like DNA-binding protein [Kutzneria viridogrisea]
MPAHSALLPIEHVDVTTSDPEVAQATLDELYVPNWLHRPDTDSFTLRLRRHAVGDLCVDQVRISGSLSLDTAAFPRRVFGFLHAGQWSGATRREELRGRAGLTYALPPQDAGAYTLSAIAAAARGSPRALQDAFRHHDTTPMAYLHQVRLYHAYQDLLAATGDTIAEIARRWGFATPGQFSARYRDTYGHPPHRDLVHEPL